MRTDFPAWSAFTPAKAASDLPRLLDEAQAGVEALESASPRTYEDLVWRLDDLTRPLYETWGRLGHMVHVMNSADWRKVQEDFQPRLVAFCLRVGQSQPLYAAAKAIRESGVDDPVRRRILAHMVQEAELAGVGLAGKARERFNAIAARLAQLSSDFFNAVIDATNAFKFEKDGKTYTIDDANYPETMKHCADREVRERLYRARIVRAPENAERIREILALRREQADLLGFADYAALSLATKCAPSVAAVDVMIDRLDAATAKGADDEEAELAAFSATFEDSPLGTLRPWDRAFAAERLRERKYAYSEDELKRHFELEDVLAGLWRMTRFLFGVEIGELKGADRPDVWQDDVRVFAVREDGETVAHFYFDPFVRSGLKGGGAWMNEFRNRRRRGNETLTPLAVIVTNFPEKDAAGKCFLPFREVETLFHEFGHALQCMLTRVDEEDAAGVNLVEWDAVEVASQFMENWCLDDRTGIRVPDELKRKVRAAKNFRAATACRRQLAFALTDLRLHGSAIPADPNGLKNGIFGHFGLPILPEDGFLNAFSHIFAGGYAAGYYGYKWAEVMSADCYGAFEEAGLDDETKVTELGRLYRRTVLALGGGESALDVFRRFRGRDPDIAALLRQQGLA